MVSVEHSSFYLGTSIFKVEFSSSLDTPAGDTQPCLTPAAPAVPTSALINPVLPSSRL